MQTEVRVGIKNKRTNKEGQEQEFLHLPKDTEGWVSLLRVGAGGACFPWLKRIDCPSSPSQLNRDQNTALGLLQVVLVQGINCPPLLMGPGPLLAGSSVLI